MKLLLLSDIHAIPHWMSWIHGEAWAGEFDLVAIAGDLLDAFSQEPIGAQTKRVATWIEDLSASGVPLAICSGNHDTEQAPWPDLEKGLQWLRKLGRPNLVVDEQSAFIRNSILASCCPYNFYYNEVDERTEQMLLAAGKINPGLPWLLLHHDPPAVVSVVSGEKFGASESLKRWLHNFRPEFVLSGHFHSAPYESGFATKILNSWCLNPGMMSPAPQPNRIILDVESRLAEWVFSTGIFANAGNCADCADRNQLPCSNQTQLNGSGPPCAQSRRRVFFTGGFSWTWLLLFWFLILLTSRRACTLKKFVKSYLQFNTLK